jgi:hypothetical protein
MARVVKSNRRHTVCFANPCWLGRRPAYRKSEIVLLIQSNTHITLATGNFEDHLEVLSEAAPVLSVLPGQVLTNRPFRQLK